MSAHDRPNTTAGVLACLGGLVLLGASCFWAARTTRSTNREVAQALRQQSAEMVRLAERMESLEQTCARPARVSSAIAAAPQGVALSAEQVEHMSAVVATRLAEANAPAPPPEPTPDNLVAAESAHQLITVATTTKHWTEADKRQLKLLMRQLTSEQQAETRSELAVAVNSQALHLDYQGPPL